MGHRLTKIATRTGDGGETGLGDGTRVPKNAARVCALGEVDELNSALGVLLAEELPGELRAPLAQVQQDLLDLGGELSIPGHRMVGAEHVARIDALLAQWNAALPPLREFILPGGTRAAAAAHLARTVCRRAERSLVALGGEAPVGEHARQYLNRLSDLLFVAGRVLNRHAGRGDQQWRHERKR
jgi:cob(I)alamin adenosyltransferase